MTIKISGVLKNGMGQPIPNCTIELISKKTTLNVITKTEANLLIDSAGSYSMNVEPSEYSVSLHIEGFSPKYVGNIRVYSDSKPGTLNEFLMLPGESDLTPELVAIFLKLRDEAEQAAKDAKESATESAASAGEANAAAESSTDILNQVTEIHVDITNKHEQVGLDATEIREAVETAKTAADWAGTYANQAAGMAQAAENHNNYAQRAAQDAEKAKVASEASAKNALSSSTAADNSKAGAESAKREAEAAALATAQDRAAVSADKQTVSNDKVSAEQAAATASASALAAESDKVRAEAAASNASDSASAANASAVAATAAANSVKSLSATGETLSPGSPASAEWDAETNTLIIGVPQGDIGPQGEKGEQGEQGIQGYSIRGDRGPQGEKGDKGDPGPASGVNEAPVDGKIYGRKDLAWSEIVTGNKYPSATSITFDYDDIIWPTFMVGEGDSISGPVLNLRVGANGLLSDVKFMFTPTAGLWPENAYIAVVYADVPNFGIFGGHRRSNTIMNENSYVTTDVGDFNIEPYDSFYHYDMGLVIKSDGPINFTDGAYDLPGKLTMYGTALINDSRGTYTKRIIKTVPMSATMIVRGSGLGGPLIK